MSRFQRFSTHLKISSTRLESQESSSQVRRAISLVSTDSYLTLQFGSFLHRILKPYAKSASGEIRRTDGLHRAADCIHGRCFREYFEAVEQAPRDLYVEHFTAATDARARVFHSFYIKFPSCYSNGTDARHERVNPVHPSL